MYEPCWVRQKLVRFEESSNETLNKIKQFKDKWRKKGAIAVREAERFLRGETEAGGFTFRSPERSYGCVAI